MATSWVFGIERPLMFATKPLIAASPDLGLGRVVTGRAQVLKVLGVEEQITVATVRPDVIDDRERERGLREWLLEIGRYSA